VTRDHRSEDFPAVVLGAQRESPAPVSKVPADVILRGDRSPGDATRKRGNSGFE
jgi:hypothetical protein